MYVSSRLDDQIKVAVKAPFLMQKTPVSQPESFLLEIFYCIIIKLKLSANL